MSLWQNHKEKLLIFISILLYFFFGYFLERTQFNTLIFIWILLFGCFYLIMKNNQLSFISLVSIGILFRVIFLFAIPNLSQDFYRFIWDGRMIFNGLNPYLSLPETFIQHGRLPVFEAEELYNGMGKLNGSHYTNYPPLNQLNFLIAAIFASKSIFWSVVVLRLQIILADIGIIYFGRLLLKNLNINPKNIFWYVLNPFIIIELTGNLHFEPVMLFFLIFAMYKLQQRKWVIAAFLLACSISVKLIPFLFLPLIYQWFVKNNTVENTPKQLKLYKHFTFKFSINYGYRILQLFTFYIIIIGTTILFFMPFYSSALINNYSNSIGLWFRNFEFNASFYYIFREIGYLFRGWNEIAIIGKITPIITILFIIISTFFRRNNPFKNLTTAMLFGLSFYYFTTTTMHPWYLATLVFLSVFTKYRFPIVWSFVIILSYQAYANTPWKENLWVVSLEYLWVYSFLLYEVIQHKKRSFLV